MKFSTTTLLATLLTLTSAAAVLPRAPQNGNRPVPNGQCCVANTSLAQDACNNNGQAGRCVPGGNNCGGSLSCVALSGLECDDNVQERSNTLCRARAGNGQLIEGAGTIASLADATIAGANE